MSKKGYNLFCSITTGISTIACGFVAYYVDGALSASICSAIALLAGVADKIAEKFIKE